MGTEDMIAIVSAVIAFFSMVVTIVLFKLNYNQVKMINEISLRSNYYEKIFDEHLIKHIPNARKYLRFQNDRLVDTENLVTELTKLRIDSLYFKYSNKPFYNKLKEITQDIEDYLMECGNKRFEPEEQAEIYQKIHKMISELYDIISKSHTGNL